MKLTKVNIAGCEIDVCGLEDLTGSFLIGAFRPYMQDIERACAVALSKYGGIEKFEIHVTPGFKMDDTGEEIPGTMRLMRVVDEWDWPPPFNLNLKMED